MQDVRYAVRSFLKTPAFTAVIVLTLALGIGANTAIFSVVHAVLLRPLPYSHPEQLFRVRRGSSFPDLRDWRLQTTSFSSIGGWRPQAFDYTGGDEAERHDGAFVTGELLATLGARAVRGELIGPRHDIPGAERVAMISTDFWRTRLGADPEAIGRRLEFNGSTYTVIGILDPGFELPGARVAVLAPFLPENPREAASRGAHTLRAIVRLQAHVTLAQAQQEMNALAARLEQQYPESNRDVRFNLQPLAESVTGSIRAPLLLIMATVAVVLLIACVNVANLLIARGAARRGEIAVRAALGAGQSRLLRQLLTESLLLAAAGGAAGLAVAWWMTRAVVALAPEGVPRLDQVALNHPALAFTASVAIATGLIFGLLPALSAARTSLGDASRAGMRATAGGGFARSTLMAAEIALALVLVVGAGLLLRSFSRLVSQPLGFDAEGLVTANITFSGQRYLDIPSRIRIFEAFEEAVRAMPGVRGVAMTTDLPIGGNAIFHNFAFEGRPMAPGTEPEIYYRGVNPDYFAVMGIPLRRGRAFTPHDRAGTPLVAVVNEAFVREYFPSEDALGRRIRWAGGDVEWITIVGIVADVRALALESGEVPAVHMSYRQEQAAWRMWMDVAVRTDGAAADLIPAMRRELARLDRTVPLTKAGTMASVVARSIADRRFNLYLLGGFALLSLLLAAAGTYGVMSYAVVQRMREMGVRLALGARPMDVFGLVVGRALLLAIAGITAGLTATIALSRVMSGFLFEIAPTDVPTLVAAATVLLGAAVLASYLPARRAARVDPIIALRSE